MLREPERLRLAALAANPSTRAAERAAAAIERNARIQAQLLEDALDISLIVSVAGSA